MTKVAFTPKQWLYFWAVIIAGLAITILSLADLALEPVPAGWLFLAALTLLTGSFTIRITKLSIRISVSDAFVFASVLLFGTAATTVLVAVDSLVGTLSMRRENRSAFRYLFNVSVASLSIWIASTVFHWMVGELPGSGEFVLTPLLAPLFVLASVYFLLNSWLIAIALGFEQHVPILIMWWRNFPWFSLNYFGGVSAAALLVSYTRSVDIFAVSIILPLLIISYLTYRTSLARLQEAQQHVDQLNSLYMSTIETLAMAIDAKDQITHGHIRRVQVYAVYLAKQLGVTDEHQLRAIEAAALLHDMGKLAIPEHILNKPGKLTAAEFDKMKRHADIGADLLSRIKFPYPVVPIVRHHHENWDGRGYPAGIAGADIPLGARILSVVDCFDALTSDRPYRPRLSNEDAFKILKERSGTMYDPLVVDTFIAVYPEIAAHAIRAGEETTSVLGKPDANDAAGENRAFYQIRMNASETAVLKEYADRIASASSTTDALAMTAQAIRQLTPATTCAIYRYDTVSDQLICDAAAGDPEHVLAGLTVRLGERVTGWSAANQRTSINSDATLDLSHIAGSFSPPLRSTIAVPLVCSERLVGVLTSYSTRHDAFDEGHRYIIQRIGTLLAQQLTHSAIQGSTLLSFSTQKFS